VSWWRGEGDTLDQIGGDNGAFVGNTTFSRGNVGQGFTFDGLGDAVPLGNPQNLQLQDFTIEGWIRRASPTVTSQDTPTFGFIFGCTWGGYGLGLWNDGRLCLTKVGYSNISSTNTITDTAFHHVAVTKFAGTISFYIDGVGESTGPYDPGFVFNGPSALGTRGSDYVSGFFGQIDELAIYGRPLSTSEIQGIYNAGVSGKCLNTVPPFFTSQPTSRTVTAGASTTFTAVLGGSIPLSYQWQFNGTNLPGATTSSLSLINVSLGQAGNYSITVTNSAGYTSSTNALLTVTPPPATIRITSTNVAAGVSFNMPVTIAANGNENALGFSLTFDPTLLTYSGAVAGSGAVGASLTPNLSLLSSGKLGLTLILQPGATLSPGTQQVVQISFVAAVITNSSRLSQMTFGDQPTARQLLDAQFTSLPANFTSASVTIAPATAFEGDIFPRPNGDKATSLSDWLQIGKYAARLDSPTNAAEFQRADCAPRATLGDGVIKVTDWVQVGRYVAGVSPLTPAGGPTNEITNSGPSPSATRLLSLANTNVGPEQPFNVSLTLSSQGNENAAGFSVSFDPTLARFASAVPGADATGATLYVNTNQLASGRLGFALALGTGAGFTSGTRELVRLSFLASSTQSGNFSASFGDQPVPREISDVAAVALPVSFVNGSITVLPPPTLTVGQSGQNILLAWPLWATNFSLQQAAGGLPPAVNWSNLLIAPTPTNNQNILVLPLGAGPNFYRLSQP
jgi:hypothetical protein